MEFISKGALNQYDLINPHHMILMLLLYNGYNLPAAGK